jgi:hypothetical protein
MIWCLCMPIFRRPNPIIIFASSFVQRVDSKVDSTTHLHRSRKRHKKAYFMIKDDIPSGSNNRKHVNIIERYSRFVDKSPLIAKAVTAGLVSAMANLFSQTIVPLQGHSQLSSIIISWRRVTAFMLTGFLFIGPYLHVWYDLLNRVCAPCQQPATRAIVKMLVDQTIGVCIFFPLYFMCMEITESVVAARGKYLVRLHWCLHRTMMQACYSRRLQ